MPRSSGVTNLNIQPPVAIKFIAVNPSQVAAARNGICPHCPLGEVTLETKHTCEAIQFKQCTRCEVVVALEKA